VSGGLPYRSNSDLAKKSKSDWGKWRVVREMNKTAHRVVGRRVLDYAEAAVQQMTGYCAARPGSPSAVRRPQLFFRGELWIAVLGPSLEEGIVGIGPTVAAALRAFDAQYLAALRPPNERVSSPIKHRQSYAAQLSN
jgi:hypothetical protein